jgi:hypothetical protein
MLIFNKTMEKRNFRKKLTKNKVILINLSILGLLVIFSFSKVQAGAKPGAHCFTDNDCESGLECVYNTCLAKAKSDCTTHYDCSGDAFHLMGCFDKGDGNKCYGRHAYPCPGGDNSICAPGFYCRWAEDYGYWYCAGKESPCQDECFSSGQEEKRCNGDNVEKRICGNYDSDPCLEWSPWEKIERCSNYCLNGKCIFSPGVITKGAVITY